MKYHMIKPNPWHFDIDDTFRTWCGINDDMNPSEDLMDHFVVDWKDCDCKKCKRAYEKYINNYNESKLSLIVNAGQTHAKDA